MKNYECRDTMNSRPILGITMGDAAGIGPEIINKALSSDNVHRICRPLVIGDAEVLDDAQKVARTSLELRLIEDVSDASFLRGELDVLDLNNIDLEELKMGQPQLMTGKASYEYISKVVDLALGGEIQGITTAPISKEALNMAGYGYPGHTEILAELTGTRDYAMMFVAGPLTVILATIHVALRDACDLINIEDLLTTIRLGNQTMRRFGVEEPRIAIAGLNPHAGEEGLFGDEEIKIIKPAVDLAISQGLNVKGPFPADTLFYRAKNGEFDIVVAMYHDQGCIPIKLLGFDIGVNITVGLPIIRTSVDHGTAYRRAGLRLGTGNPSSLITALKIASKLVKGSG
ncbi:MAG: 4-hydroxythreonine-4-phosphate dehydrogenase PdxA [Candidatus Thorarchaeota archaeon]|jgi:4-hydroxythreonine-4-phosphate dehydrogenase